MTTLAPVSVALKFGFLAVLYLFVLWVARSALADLRRGDERRWRAGPAPPPTAGRRDGPALGARRRRRRATARRSSSSSARRDTSQG